MKYRYLNLAFAVLVSVDSYASDVDVADTTLKFENSPFKNVELRCSHKEDIRPTKSDFELVDYAVMSSEIGDRFALLTVSNKSSGQRIFNQSHIVAVLGDCSRKHPYSFERKFLGNEDITLTVQFGLSRFPLVKIIADE